MNKSHHANTFLTCKQLYYRKKYISLRSLRNTYTLKVGRGGKKERKRHTFRT